jgi:cardiolipin synthase
LSFDAARLAVRNPGRDARGVRGTAVGRSVAFNSEINAVILGAPFGREMEAMFQDDIAHSREIDAAHWADRPLGERLDEWGSRLIEVLL